MLQIISGNFYDPNKEVENTSSEVILYSNLFIAVPLDLGIGTLTMLHHEGPYCQYAFRYTHRIQKNDRPGGIVKLGEGPLLEQLAGLLGFSLRAFFSPKLETVENCCSSPASKKLVTAYLDQGAVVDMALHAASRELFQKTIALSRDDFLAVAACTMAVHNALEALHTNADLAYSLLVFGAESLAQRVDGYTPVWEDHPKHEALDQLMAGIPADTWAAIRTELLNDANLKSTQRFVGFLDSHLQPEYFMAEAASIQCPLRKSEVKDALKKVYSLRSKYAHMLQKIQQHLKIPQIAGYDVFRWENEPFLTFNGLLRLLTHALTHFIRTRPEGGTENVNWLRQLPQILLMRVSPERYIFTPETVSLDDVRSRLEGFLSLLSLAVLTGESKIADLRPVLECLRELFPQANAETKRAIYVLADLWRSTFTNDPPSDAVLKMLEDHQAVIAPCTEETMILAALRDSLSWTVEEMAEVYDKYEKNRVKPNKPCYPPPYDLLVMLHIALRFRSTSNAEQCQRWLERILLDSSGSPGLQQAIQAIIDGTDCPNPYQIILPPRPAAPPAA